MDKLSERDRAPVPPRLWKNPQNTREFFAAAGDNLLNIIPPQCYSQPYYTFFIKFVNVHFISSPELVRHVLKSNYNDFPKARSLNAILNPIAPNGIFVTNFEKWREQHKTIVPVFAPRNVNGFETPIRKTVDDYVKRMQDQGQEVDVQPLMQEMTFEIISQVLLSDHQNPLLKEVRDAFEDYLQDAVRVRLMDLVMSQIPFTPNVRYLTNPRVIKKLHKVPAKIVAERLKQPPPAESDFLEYLISVYDLRNDFSHKKSHELSDQLITFLIAGHETTAMALSWALHALSFFPDYQETIAKEADYSPADMIATENFLKESMRFFPPVPMIARRSNIDYEADGLQIKKNESILIPIIALHQHSQYWENPEEFIPNRFENFEPHPLSYMPFGAGPRICIGASFAMLEAKIALSKLMQKFQVTSTGHVPEPHQALTMRSSNGMHVKISERKGE